MPDSQPIRRWAGIRCQECGWEDDSDERGWKAYLSDADNGGDEVLVFRPQCSEREFWRGVAATVLTTTASAVAAVLPGGVRVSSPDVLGVARLRSAARALLLPSSGSERG